MLAASTETIFLRLLCLYVDISLLRSESRSGGSSTNIALLWSALQTEVCATTEL